MVLGTCVPQQVVKLKTVTGSKTGDISVGMEMVYTSTHQRGDIYIKFYIHVFIIYKFVCKLYIYNIYNLYGRKSN